MISEEIAYYKNLSMLVNTPKDKIRFFDQNQKAFFLDHSSDNWLYMMRDFAKLQNLTMEQVSQIEDFKWIEMPEKLKLFAFDYCILNGSIYK